MSAPGAHRPPPTWLHPRALLRPPAPRRRVHISQSTMDCLKGEFDVEPGEGGSRCDYLEEKGIETYLIIASKPEVKKSATQNGLNGSVSPSTPGLGGGQEGLQEPMQTSRQGVREPRRSPTEQGTRGRLLTEGKLAYGADSACLSRQVGNRVTALCPAPRGVSVALRRAAEGPLRGGSS